MGELFNLFFLTTSLTLVETVEKWRFTFDFMETTSVKDVYTTVSKSVDNHLGCVEDICSTQAVYRLFTSIGELSTVIHRVVNRWISADLREFGQ